MAVNETIVTGRKWRRCINVANKLWQRISYWTKASDVEFDDGQTAENKMGAISGITSDLNGESENIAASIKAVNQLNNNLAQQPIFIYDSSGKITGYKTKAGADSIFPFSGSGKWEKIYTGSTTTWPSVVTCNVTDYDIILFELYHGGNPYWAAIPVIKQNYNINGNVTDKDFINHLCYYLYSQWGIHMYLYATYIKFEVYYNTMNVAGIWCCKNTGIADINP